MVMLFYNQLSEMNITSLLIISLLSNPKMFNYLTHKISFQNESTFFCSFGLVASNFSSCKKLTNEKIKLVRLRSTLISIVIFSSCSINFF